MYLMTFSFQTIAITFITTFSLLFFLSIPFYPFSTPHQKRSLLSQPPCPTFNGIFPNYFSLHFCTFNSNPFISLPFLSLTLLLHFYILIKTAQSHFSLIVTKLSLLLSLNPSMAAVTLLALGNGAPDVFASISAVSKGNSRTGFGAILSAGTFVSGFVVGVVGINAGPFRVDSVSFVRDVMFYLMAGLMLFYVYLSGELYFWQSVGFVGFYLVFVGFVFWMDFGSVSGKIDGGFEKEEVVESVELLDCEKGDHQSVVGRNNSRVFGAFKKISSIWETPVSLLLKLTIPQTSPNAWSRFYQSANIALCPLALLYSCNQFILLNHPVIFLIPKTPLPLWLVVLFSSSSLAILHYIIEKEPPKTEQIHIVLLAFIMSVFWISNIAGELLNCLAALGKILNLPPSILGLTVLAWGNSVGDLVADVALAKAGQPALAMAGCFAGPMFNMLVGLGTGLVIQTAKVYPEPYVLKFHISIVVAFVFLFLSLMGSLLVVTWSRFRVPRFWGFCLVGLYVVFIFVSLVIAKFST